MCKIRTFCCLLVLWIMNAQAQDSTSLQVRDDGYGEALIIPFFSVQNGWHTYIDINNNGGMLHLKLRSAETGDVFSAFNVYLPKNGVLRATLSSPDSFGNYPGGPGISFASDAGSMCVVGGAIGEPSWGGYDRGYGRGNRMFPIAHTIGSIEVYSLRYNTEAKNPYIGCSTLIGRWDDGGRWQTEPLLWVTSVSNPKARAFVTLINIEEAVSVNYTATALSNTGIESVHEHPLRSTIDLSRVTGGIEAVAKALNASKITNDIVNLESINASTEWVLTYPLAGYGYHQGRETLIDGQVRYCDSFGTDNLGPDSPLGGALLGDPIRLSLYGGGQEVVKIPNASWSSFDACYAVNLISFQLESLLSTGEDLFSVKQQKVSQMLKSIGGAGVLSWSMEQPSPVLGFRITNFSNGTLDGGKTLSNYSILTPHKFD